MISFTSYVSEKLSISCRPAASSIRIISRRISGFSRSFGLSRISWKIIPSVGMWLAVRTWSKNDVPVPVRSPSIDVLAPVRPGMSANCSGSSSLNSDDISVSRFSRILSWVSATEMMSPNNVLYNYKDSIHNQWSLYFHWALSDS